MSYSKVQYQRGAQPSAIRELAAYGSQRKREVGADKVYDFSIGAPSLPTPEAVQEELKRLLEETEAEKLHNYTSSAGDPAVRQALAHFLEDRYGDPVDPGLLYLTAGAAAGLSACFHALAEKGDNFLSLTPCFPEYRVFVEQTGAEYRESPCSLRDFQPDIEDFRRRIDRHTKGVILNQPCNPTGVIFDRSKLEALTLAMREKEMEYGHPIYLIADEVYRELVYEKELAYLPDYYANTLIVYSFSKSLSLAGERIGYIQVTSRLEEAEAVYYAICGAGRSLGYVCAPSLFQYLLPACLGKTVDVSVYRKNRDLLYSIVTECGFQAVHPDGAFYLFMKSPVADAKAFSQAARAHDLLLVPSDSFGCPGWVRLSYCVDTDLIRRSAPAFRALAEEFALGGEK